MNTVYHSGDLGDIIASLPVVRALGGAHYRIGPGECRESMKGARFDAIRPLLLAQAYIHSIEWQEGPSGATHDLSCFRRDPRDGESLADWQARFLDIAIDLHPWLTAAPSAATAGRVVVANSGRWRNEAFPWTKLLRRHYRDALFVGTRNEHDSFQHRVSCRLEYLPTANLLELAEAIAGCRLFIGNQSCPFWIAAGLGVPVIQEICPACPNSIIERPNAQYWYLPPEDFR